MTLCVLALSCSTDTNVLLAHMLYTDVMTVNPGVLRRASVFESDNEGTVMVNLQNRRLFALFVGILLIASCQSDLRSNVVAFHEEPLPMGETIKVLPLDPEKSDSLEFRSYANLIREELR